MNHLKYIYKWSHSRRRVRNKHKKVLQRAHELFYSKVRSILNISPSILILETYQFKKNKYLGTLDQNNKVNSTLPIEHEQTSIQ
jgi:hypothetical protein